MKKDSLTRSRSTKRTYCGLTRKQVNDLHSLAGNAERNDLIAALDGLKVDPPASEPTTESVLREFISDVEAVGVTAVREQMDWPDLAATYDKAVKTLAPARRTRISKSLLMLATPKAMVAYPYEDWQDEVRNGDTRLGYTEWVAHNVESHADDANEN